VGCIVESLEDVNLDAGTYLDADCYWFIHVSSDLLDVGRI